MENLHIFKGDALRKIPKFDLIFWCRNIVETNSFAIRLTLCGNCVFPQNFYIQQIGVISGYGNYGVFL